MEVARDEVVTELDRRRYILSEIAEYADRLSRPIGDDAEDRRAREQLIQWLDRTDRATGNRVSPSELGVIGGSPKTQTQPPEGSAWPRRPNSIERDE
jgi:hypothetical protein